jgi:hypothetical protein
VTQHLRNRAVSRAQLARGLALACGLGLVGCSDTGQGTVQVATESRQRLVPHVDSQAKGPRLQGAAGKSFSIKDRARPPASP